MMSQEKPQVELYLYSLNQEFPVGKGQSTFLEQHSKQFHDPSGKPIQVESVIAKRTTEVAGDWPGQWIHNQWVENYTKIAGASLSKGATSLANLVLREEDFGGIAFDPTMDRVYRANRPGFKLLVDLVNAAKAGQLQSFQPKEYKAEEVDSFLAFLKGAGLWA